SSLPRLSACSRGGIPAQGPIRDPEGASVQSDRLPADAATERGDQRRDQPAGDLPFVAAVELVHRLALPQTAAVGLVVYGKLEMHLVDRLLLDLGAAATDQTVLAVRPDVDRELGFVVRVDGRPAQIGRLDDLAFDTGA